MRPLFIDIELETARRNLGWFGGLPGTSGKIVSWHDLNRTPALPTLRRKRAMADSLGGITKIVTLARAERDNLRVLELYDRDPGRLVAFCMGEVGTASRMASFQLGSPIVYASLPSEPVAPGQLSVTTACKLKRILEKGAW